MCENNPLDGTKYFQQILKNTFDLRLEKGMERMFFTLLVPCVFSLITIVKGLLVPHAGDMHVTSSTISLEL